MLTNLHTGTRIFFSIMSIENIICLCKLLSEICNGTVCLGITADSLRFEILNGTFR